MQSKLTIEDARELACDVAGAVRMGLDQMERDEKREGKVVFV